MHGFVKFTYVHKLDHYSVCWVPFRLAMELCLLRSNCFSTLTPIIVNNVLIQTSRNTLVPEIFDVTHIFSNV